MRCRRFIVLIHKSDGTPYSAEEGCVWLGMLSSVVYKHLTVPCSSSNSQELPCSWTCLVAQMVKNLPAMQDTWVQSLGQEDPLKKVMATHSSILAWRIPWTEENPHGQRSPAGYSPWGTKNQRQLGD